MIAALLIAAAPAVAFTPIGPARATSALNVEFRESGGSSVFDQLAPVIRTVEKKQVLSAVADLGLLTRAAEAGVKIQDLGPLLEFADDSGALALVEATPVQLLPLLVNTAPLLIGLLKPLTFVPAPLVLLGAPVSIAAAAALVATVPDEDVIDVAIQVFGAVVLGAVVPA